MLLIWSTEAGQTHLREESQNRGFLCVWAVIWEGACEGARWGARNVLSLDLGCGYVGGNICKHLSIRGPYAFSGKHNTIYNVFQPKAFNLNLIKILDLTSSFQEMER